MIAAGRGVGRNFSDDTTLHASFVKAIGTATQPLGFPTRSLMDLIDTVPAMECPQCKARLQVRAYLPALDALPAVAGYWCDDCQKETTVEIDTEE